MRCVLIVCMWNNNKRFRIHLIDKRTKTNNRMNEYRIPPSFADWFDLLHFASSSSWWHSKAMFSIDWHQKFLDIVVYAGNQSFFLLSLQWFAYSCSLASNPWQFLYYVFLFLTPMFAISGYLAYRLAKDIERNERVTRTKNQQKINVAKLRKHAKKEWMNEWLGGFYLVQ